MQSLYYTNYNCLYNFKFILIFQTFYLKRILIIYERDFCKKNQCYYYRSILLYFSEIKHFSLFQLKIVMIMSWYNYFIIFIIINTTDKLYVMYFNLLYYS